MLDREVELVISRPMRILLSLGLLVSAGACNRASFGQPNWADTALLADFKRVCIDTALEPARIREAAASTGATVKSEGPFNGIPSVFWSHATGGKVIQIWLLDPSHDAQYSVSAICNVAEPGVDDAKSLRDLRRWLGAPSLSTPGPDFGEFDFVMTDGKPRLVEAGMASGPDGQSLTRYRITFSGGLGHAVLTLSKRKRPTV